MDTYTPAEAQHKIEDLLRNVLEERRHCRITSDLGTVVVLPEETYHNLAVTLELLSTPGLLDSVHMDEPQEVAS